MILTVLCYILVASTSIQLIYFSCFSSILFHKQAKKHSREIPVSVIVCAKNETDNLTEFIPSILNQDYRNFELVLINDASTDNTLEIMQDFKEKHSNIKIVNVENNEAFWGNKKYALTLGIKAATHEYLLFTDADCNPVSSTWISEMTSNFSNEKTIVLGYGKYNVRKSLVNLCIRFETLLTAVQYFTYAKLGSPYMGVGRNLAYTKAEFFKTKGFINHIKVKSGDDDLFIQEAANKQNTVINLSPDSFTTSIPPLTFKAWFRQKRRHVSTSSYYQFKHQFFLGLFYFSKLVFYTLTTVLFFFYSWKIIALILAIYLATFMTVFGIATKKFKEPYLLFLLPFLEIFLLLFQFTIFISNTFSKPTHWK
jgi:glycosyltransferase involved in cell wall biosynthesis